MRLPCLAFVFALLAPSAASAAGYFFSKDSTADFYCTPEQQIDINEQGNGAIDLLRYGGDELVQLAGAGGPGSDPTSQGALQEAEHWFGKMPAGDPAHPGPELAAWQERVRKVGWYAEIGARMLDPGEMFAICPHGASRLCERPDDADTVTYYVALELPGMATPIPTQAFCPSWFTLPPRGGGGTLLDIYFNKAAFTGHELMHAGNPRSDLDDLTPHVDLDEAEAFASDSRSGNSMANAQFALAGIDNRRHGGAGSDNRPSKGGGGGGGGGGAITNAGCAACGPPSPGDVLFVLSAALFLGLGARRRRSAKA